MAPGPCLGPPDHGASAKHASLPHTPPVKAQHGTHIGSNCMIYMFAHICTYTCSCTHMCTDIRHNAHMHTCAHGIHICMNTQHTTNVHITHVYAHTEHVIHINITHVHNTHVHILCRCSNMGTQYTQSHTHPCTCTAHTCMHTCTTHSHRYRHTCTYILTHMHMHAHTHSHTHVPTHLICHIALWT